MCPSTECMLSLFAPIYVFITQENLLSRVDFSFNGCSKHWNIYIYIFMPIPKIYKPPSKLGNGWVSLISRNHCLELNAGVACLVHPGVREKRRVSEIDLSQPRHETTFWWRHNGPVTSQLTDSIQWPNYPWEIIGIYALNWPKFCTNWSLILCTFHIALAMSDEIHERYISMKIYLITLLSSVGLNYVGSCVEQQWWFSVSEMIINHRTEITCHGVSNKGSLTVCSSAVPDQQKHRAPKLLAFCEWIHW